MGRSKRHFKEKPKSAKRPVKGNFLRKIFSPKNFMGWFIVIIMTLSTLAIGIFRNSESSGSTYNNYKFSRKDQSTWMLDYNGNEIEFHNLPQTLEFINISPIWKSKLMNSQQLVATFDPKYRYLQYIDLARFELTNALSLRNVFVVNAQIQNSSLYNLPVLTCENSSQYVPVLFFKSSNDTKLSEKGNCLILEAKLPQDFLALKDRVVYEALGVMK